MSNPHSTPEDSYRERPGRYSDSRGPRHRDDDDDDSHAAAEVLPTPAAPKLSTSYDEESIVNFDYLEETGSSDDLSHDEMLALINQYEETLTDIQEGQILEGTVIEVRENEVLLNIGFKSEGVINLDEFGAAQIAEGDTFESEEMSAKCPSKYEDEAKVAGGAPSTPRKD